nr:hypothetical protein [Acidobacteriota bacterium]
RERSARGDAAEPSGNREAAGLRRPWGTKFGRILLRAMQRLKRLAVWCALALFFALALSGCFLSNLQPWHEPGTAVYEPALLGTWAMKNCSDNDENKQKYCVMTFKPRAQEHHDQYEGKKDQGYEITFRGDNGVESTFSAFLFEASGERFLESVADTPPKLDPAFALHIVPVNVLWRVRMSKGQLSLEPMKLSWAADLARSGKLPPHVMTDKNSPLLNATPKQATAFLAEYAKDPQAFDDAKVWTKGAPQAATAAPKPQKKK